MKHRENTKAAFTLIEMMASVAILGMMMFLLFAAFNQTSKAWLQGESRVETFSSARAALDYMSRELAQAMVNTNALQFFGTNTAVAFIAPAGDNYGARVDMAEVVYRLSQPSAANVSQPPTADPGGFFTNSIAPYRLVRRFTPYSDIPPSLACYDYGQMQPTCSGSGNPWDFYSYNNWMETSAYTNTAVLAENIVSLNFTFVTTNGIQYPFWNSTTESLIWNHELPNNGIPYNTMDVYGNIGSGCALHMTNHAPAGVVITIGAVDSRTAIRLQAIAQGITPPGTNASNVGPFTNTLNQAVQFFTTFVAIPNQ
jgi:prepilin-type N-terminal cleavage/methylation domain-containing protein